MINDKLIQFERAFIDCEGLPGRPMYKWVQLSLTMVLVYIQLIYGGTLSVYPLEIIKAYGTKDWVKCKALNQLFWYHSATVTGFAYGKIDRNT